MYLVNLKVTRKEGSKPLTEQYLVNGLNLTDVEVKLNTEFKDTPIYTVSCKEFKNNDIFENGEGSFFLITLLVDDLDGKTVKEIYLQEAIDNDDARVKFRNNIDYGVILDVVSKPFMGIIR